MGQELIDALCELKEDDAVGMVKEALAGGADPGQLLGDCQAGLAGVGARFEAGEYFLSELVYAGAIFKRISDMLERAIQEKQGQDRPETKGKVVIGTISGDVHDLGKNIVVTLLKGSGFEVYDLGTDVPIDDFVAKLEETDANVLGMSALLTTSFGPMKQVVEILQSKGLRDKIKIMIGGGVVDDMSLKFIGADMQSRSAYEAVVYCNGVYGE